MHRNPTLVHLSDLHFDSFNHDKIASGALAKAMIALEASPDFLVVTGDLTQLGRKREMNAAKNYLLGLLNQLWEKRKHVARCLVVPGNHDVLPANWMPLGWFPRKGTWNQIFPDWSFLAPNVPATETGDLTPASLASLYEQQGLKPDRAAAKAKEALRYCEYYPAFQLVFIKIDSNCRRYLAPWNTARGAVGRKQFQKLDEFLEDYTSAFPADGPTEGFEDARRIALVHHHVVHLPLVKNEATMLLDDAGDLRDRFARHRIDLIVHGHRHRANQLGLVHWSQEHEEFRTVVLSGGSACAHDKDDGCHSYHFIRFRCFQTEVWRLQRVNSEFEPVKVEDRPPYRFRRQFQPRLERSKGPYVAEGRQVELWLEPLEATLRAAEERGDQKHRYSSISCTGYIDGANSYWGRYVLAGVNTSGQKTSYLPFHLTAVGAQDFKDFELEGYDLVGNRTIHVEPEELSGFPVFPIRLYFPSPLEPHESFHLQVKFCLPRVMLTKTDYDLVNLLRFPLGVGSLTHTLLASRSIVDPAYLAVGSRRIAVTDIHPESVEEDTEWGAAKGYRVIIKNPNAMCYLFSYRSLG